jgi:hypothetical protein
MYLAIAQSSYYPHKVFNNNNSTSSSKKHTDKEAIEFQNLKIEIEKKDTKLRQVITQASHFTQGFIKGKGANVAGVAGSVVADFTVIGDARDLTREYGKYQKGENINELIVLLSGAGVGLTALTFGTRGTAAPAKVGASVIKVAVKTQRLTKRFQKHLLKLGRQVFDWSAFRRVIKHDKSISNIRRAAKQAYHPNAIQPLERISKQVNNIRKSTSTVDAVHLLKYIDSPKDLIQLEKVSLKYGTKTKGMMKLLGKGALRTVRVLQKTTKLLLSLLSSLLSALFSLFLLFTRKSIG